jgi:hypothetical protein
MLYADIQRGLLTHINVSYAHSMARVLTASPAVCLVFPAGFGRVVGRPSFAALCHQRTAGDAEEPALAGVFVGQFPHATERHHS